MTLKDLLARASPAALARWEDLSLAYPDDSRGDASLREAIAAAYEADRETEDRVAGGRGRAGPTQAEEVTVCVPAEGILLAMLALVGRGDRVVVAAPHYQSLGEIAKALGATIVEWTPRIDASGACGGGGSKGVEAGGFTPQTWRRWFAEGRVSATRPSWCGTFPITPQAPSPPRKSTRTLSACAQGRGRESSATKCED